MLPCTLFHAPTHTSSLTLFHVLASQAKLPFHRQETLLPTMCHSSHVMRHSGYRHLDPSKHTADGREARSAGFYIHAFLLFCWFLASVHWAWVWYTKRRDAREKECGEQYCLPLYESQLRDGPWEECGDQVGLLLWPDDSSMSGISQHFLVCFVATGSFYTTHMSRKWK